MPVVAIVLLYYCNK